jgi:hypothetical protein
LPWAITFRPVGAGKALFIPWPPSGSIADTISDPPPPPPTSASASSRWTPTHWRKRLVDKVAASVGGANGNHRPVYGNLSSEPTYCMATVRKSDKNEKWGKSSHTEDSGILHFRLQEAQEKRVSVMRPIRVADNVLYSCILSYCMLTPSSW